MKPRALLLNPPFPDLLIRDYYCSKTTKSNYIFQPVDLVIQSGRLDAHYELKFIDAVVDKLGEAECRRQALEFKPDLVLFLSGAVSWTGDFPFLRSLKEALPGSLFVGSGDIFQEEGERWLRENDFIDAVIRDFSNDDVVRYAQGDDQALQNIVYRRSGEIRQAAGQRVRREFFDIPTPRQDLFMRPGYHFSFVRREPFATVLTDFGCPYPCTFCIQSTLGFKYRSADNVMEELRLLQRLGVKEIFFQDQTWGTHKERNLEICRRMVEEKMDFGWVTFCRVDIISEEAIRAWRAAGCHTLMFGVEFANADMLKKYKKGYRPDQIIAGLKMAQDLGIRTVGTFLIGLPEETRETLQATAQLACDLPLDFASFNVAVPRYGTPLRGQAKEEGLIDDLRVMDQAGADVAMATNHLSRQEVSQLKQEAVRRFYLRPGYLWRRLTHVGSWFELRSQLGEGMALLARNSGLSKEG